ncbi:MAG: hypothetical protein ACFFD1_05140 [Candidatus Thorarchaeota archaeon]
MSKTLDKINKILKRTTTTSTEEEIVSNIDQKEIINVFTALENLFKTSFEKGLVEGATALASVHHSLFENAVYNNNEKARLSLLFLKAKFKKLAHFTDPEFKIFLYNYSKMWFKLFITLEAKAQIYVGWLDFSLKHQKNLVNYEKLVSDFDKFLPDFDTNTIINDMVNEEIRKRLYDILYKKTTTTAGFELHEWIYSLMHNYVINKDQSAYNSLLFLFFQFPPIEELIAFDEILHEYGKAWYRHSLQLKKWFLNFGQKVGQDPYLIDRMWKGLFWSKFQGKTSLKNIIDEWREKHPLEPL